MAVAAYAMTAKAEAPYNPNATGNSVPLLIMRPEAEEDQVPSAPDGTSGLIMPAPQADTPQMPPLFNEIQESLKEAYDQDWTLQCTDPFKPLSNPQESPQQCGAVWVHMMTNGLVALKRMAFDPDPKILDQHMTPKFQIEECVHMIDTLQKHQVLYSPLSLETKVAWDQVKDVCAEFPSACTFKFGGWEQLAWYSAMEWDRTSYPGLLRHFEDLIGTGNYQLTFTRIGTAFGTSAKVASSTPTKRSSKSSRFP